ncbi:MAG: zf-HC2 domain-containing protein [Acidobacteriota bacterium]
MKTALPDNCREVRQQLSAYIDEELSAEELSGVERHVATCAPCREQAEVERSFTGELRARRLGEAAPAGLMRKVRRGLEQEAARESRGAGFAAWPGRWRLALAGVGYGLALVFAIMWLDGKVPAPRPAGGVATPGAAESGGRAWVPATVELRGWVVCAICDEAGVPVEQHILCDTYGHFNGLRDDQGRLWLLVQNKGRNPDLQAHEMRGREVAVQAEAFEDVGYLIARNVHEL